jgi:localization factor PodJL
MSGARAHVHGGAREVRDTAPAARLSGAGFRNWLRSVVPDVLAGEPVGLYPSRPDQDVAPDGTPGPAESVDGLPARATAGRFAQPDRDLAALCRRLDEVTRQLANLPDGSTGERPSAPAPGAPDLTGLERQLKFLTTQLEILRSPCRADELVAELRDQLGSIAQTIENLVSRSAFRSLADEVRALGARVNVDQRVAADAPAVAAIERGLADLREAVTWLAPGELAQAVQTLSRKIDQIGDLGPDPLIFRQLDNAIDALRSIVNQIASGDALAALLKEVRALAEKIEQSTTPAPQDSAAASQDRAILLALEKQVSGLAATLAHGARPAHSVAPPVDPLIEALAQKLDRFDLLADGEAAIEPIKRHISQLGEKIDRLQPSTDHASFGPIEQRLSHLADLIEQMNRPGGQWPPLAPIEDRIRSLAEKLERLEEYPRKRDDIAGVARELPPIESDGVEQARSADDFRAQGSGETTVGSVGPTQASPAAGAPDLRDELQQRTPTPTPAQTERVTAGAGASPLSVAPTAEGTTGTAPLPSISAETSVPPDAPIEPGSGPPRSRGGRGSTGRKAAVKPPARGATASDRTGQASIRPNFIVAARRAAQAASEQQNPPAIVAEALDEAGSGAVSSQLADRVKSMFVSTSLILVGLGAAGIALSSADLLGTGRERLADRLRPPALAQAIAPTALPPAPTETVPTPATPPDSLAAVAQAPDPRSVEPDRETKLATALASSDPASTPQQPAPPSEGGSPHAAGEEATGSVGTQRNSAKPAAQPPAKPPPDPNRPWPAEPLPPAIATKPLLAGIAERNPAAAYEIGLRYAEGRGVTIDIAAAATWFARAAEGGLALAQFRLGSLYEKGTGVRKDLAEARRLYLAAAAQGNATAMHNVAVLCAEGVEGKPDHAAAVEWFRKAAEHGVVDSQYNLAILHARGVGTERDFVEALKWFSIAAAKGDKDASPKRDDIAARLDPQSQAAARRAASAFIAKPQPEEAIRVQTPPGGWDDGGGSPKPKPRAEHQGQR